jgi:hypothetical protein
MEILILIALAGWFGGWVTREYLEVTRPEREQALLIELEALRAANALGLAAWEARVAMAEEVRRHQAEGGGR